jgi:membrane protease YdiL (CAAX protease family)
MKTLVSRYPVVTFVLLTLGYQLTLVLVTKWLIGGVGDMHDHPKAHMVFRFRVFGPLFFAVAITAWLEGREGLSKLFGGYFNWRVPARWYALAFTWKFIVAYMGIAFVALIGLRPWPGFFVEQNFFWSLMKSMPFIVGIALVEETSWMKFGVTRMQERYPAWLSCLVMGLAWGLWYLPMIFIGEGVPDGVPWPVFLVSMFSLTVLLSWTYNETHSGLVLLIMQILSNCAFFMVPILPSGPGLDPMYVVAFVCAFLLVAVAILWYAGPEHLSTRGKRATWSMSKGIRAVLDTTSEPLAAEVVPTPKRTRTPHR